MAVGERGGGLCQRLLALRYIPAGVAYAIWAGLGIVLIARVGVVLLGQRLDAPR